ncbi:MAG: fibronectin type III domain-containing protein [Planctomycetia bacterium]|nr:fibronectin type III domain-containing protein [Planctomycetia bacterium]
MTLFMKLFNKDGSKPTRQKLSTSSLLKGRPLHFEALEERQLLAVVTGVPDMTAGVWSSDVTAAAAFAPMPTSGASVLDNPTDLTATSVKKDSITVTWKEVSHAGSYEVEYQLDAGTDWTKCDNVQTTTAGNVSVLVDGLDPDVTYNIRVQALPVSGSVDYSESGYTTITQRTMPPLPTPANFNAVYNADNNSMTVTWNPIDSSLYEGKYELSVYQGNKEFLGSQICTADLAVNSYTFICFDYDDQGDPKTYFDNNQLYTFTIMAQSEQADYDDSYIAETSLTTPKGPLWTPEILPHETYVESSTAIYVVWGNADPAAYSFLVEYRVSGTETWTQVTTSNKSISLRIPGLLSGTTYQVRVTAKANPNGTDEFADSAPSEIYSVKTFIKLAAPTNLTATEVVDHSISIAWDHVENADGYTVSCYREDFPEGLVTTDIEGTTYTFSGLDSNTNYSIWVLATNEDTTQYEQSGSSNKLELKTLKTTLTAPEDLELKARDLDSITLDWNNVDNVDHYLVEYRWESDSDWQQRTTNMTRLTIDSLTSGREYEFRVSSIADPDGDFLDSAPSASIEVKTLAKIDTPWNFKVYNKSNNYIILQWSQITSPSGISYEVVWYPTENPSQETTKSVDDCFTGFEGLDSNRSYTFKVKAVSSDPDYVDSDFCTPIIEKTDYEIRLSPDFTTTFAYNQTFVLGTIFIDEFVKPQDAIPTFTVNGTPNADNFSAVWDGEQNGFDVTFNNDNEKLGPIKYELRISATEDGKTASTVFPVTLMQITNINGLIVSGTEDTDWVWNETDKNLRVKGDIVITGAASSAMTISIEQDASVTNNVVVYTGASENDTPGTLTILEGEGITSDPNVTSGVLYDNAFYYFASNASFSVDGTTFTNTSETKEKLQFGSDGVHFLTGKWNVDVKEDEILTVADVAARISVNFSANDKYAYSVVTYTVGESGGGFKWNWNEYRTNMYGIALATTENIYSGVTLSSTSSNAYAVDASSSLQYLSYNIVVYGGEWTATSNDNTKVTTNLTVILQNGSLTAQLKNGSEKTFTYSEAKVDGVNASALTFDFDHTDARISNITTGYEVSGFLYTCNSNDQIITCSAIDTVAKTISLNRGNWTVQISTLDSVGSTVLTTISDSATLRGTEDDTTVYSSPSGALNSTFEVVEIDVEVEGQPKAYKTRIQNGVNDYLLGSVVVSAGYGKHTKPEIDNDLMTMTITGGDWFVSDVLTGMVGGTVVLKGGSFTDADGDSVIFHGQVFPLTVDGSGVLDLTTLTIVTTAKDDVDNYDGVTSLREAIAFAADRTAWGNVITFSDAIDWAAPANTIKLVDIYGGLVIDHTLTIDGKTQNVTVDGNYVWNVSEGVGSVFTIESTAGTEELPVSIKGLTITGGNGTKIGDDTYGGAILNYGVVTVEYSVLQNNGACYGAGVANFNQFTILNSTLYNNNAKNDGGAFYNKGTNAKMTIGNSTVAENNGNHGGGVYNDGGTLLLVNSIVVGNSGNFDVVFDNDGLNYAYYSIFGSVYNEKTKKPNGAAFDAGDTGIYGSDFARDYADVFGATTFDGQTIKIDRTSIAANSGTLVGFIGQTCYYYNVDDGFWWNGTTNTKSLYQFNAEDTTAYGLTGGSILINGQNLDLDKNRISRVVTTKAFSLGAYTIERIPDTPSTIVTITDDLVDSFDNEISLREAILYAGTSYVDASGITHTLGTDITFDPVVFADGATITLTAQLGPYLKQENAALFIDKSLSIDTTVNGELKEIIIDGKNIDDSVFYITDSAGTDLSQSKVLLKGLTITGGTGRFDYISIFNIKDHFGGAIYNTGALELLNCTIKENKAYQGGGILNLGYLSVKDSVLTANEAERFGGAIHNSGYMILNGVTMTDNSAHWGGSIINDGIATLPTFLDVKQVTAVMSDVSFENNRAENGGAIFDRAYEGNLSITIDNCSFKENSAEVYGGAVRLFAYYNSTIDSTIHNSSFIKNSAGESGGAISIEAVVSNENEIPARIGTIELVLCNSLIADNTAKEYGGGLAIYDGTLTTRNVTIAGNSVESTGGGNGGGIYSSQQTALDRVALYNTIIAANVEGDGAASDIAAADKKSTIIGYNTLSTFRGWATSEGEKNYSYFSYVPPFNDAKNGDYTLSGDSVAINQGNNTYAIDDKNVPLDKDLAGNPRIAGVNVDLGAYERQDPVFVEPALTLSSSRQEIQEPQAGQKVTLADVTIQGIIGEMTYTFTDSNGNNLEGCFAMEPDDNNILQLRYLGGLDNGHCSLLITAANAENATASAKFELSVYDLYFVALGDYVDYRIDVEDGDQTDPTGRLYGMDILDGQEILIKSFTVHPGKSIVKIEGTDDQRESLTVSPAATTLLKQIYFNSLDSAQENAQDKLVLQAMDDGAVFTIDTYDPDGDADSDTNDGFGTGSVTATDKTTLTPKAIFSFSGVKNVFIETNGQDVFRINCLTTNINLKGTDTATSIEQIDFSNIDVSSDSLGMILNLANLGLAFHQAAAIGQRGTIAFNRELASVVLSAGSDTVYASASGSTILDTTTSQSVISLKGGNNNIKLNGTATIVAVKETDENTVVINNAEGSVINLAKSTGHNEITVQGNDVIITGGTAENNVHVTGENAMINLSKGNDGTVTLYGDNAIITTGDGNDTITVRGCDNSVTAGAGDDKIIVEDLLDGNNQIIKISTGNTVNAGNGNDLIYAVLSSGSNVYCGGNGNDFILGGSGSDTIYGNSGNNFLAGYLGADTIFGGRGRDILLADRTTLMTDLSTMAMETLFANLQKDWMDNVWDQEKTLELLGQNATSDGDTDTLKRVGGELNLFFESLADSDIDNALAVDFRYFE